MGGGCQTQVPSLTRFKPENGSPFRITFFYPSNWDWEVNPDSNRNFSSITALNPYPSKESVSMPSSRLAGLMVDASPRSQTDMQERIDSFLDSIETLDWLELIADETFQIGNQAARKITVRKEPSVFSESQTYICEYMYLFAEDRSYQLHGCFLESEVGRRFHTEFKAMVESIQVLP
jgi:hypothetical protein